MMVGSMCVIGVLLGMVWTALWCVTLLDVYNEHVVYA